MKDLVEAWTWYLETVQQLRLWRRIVDKYWSHLPWQGLLEKDDRFRNLDEARLVESSDASLREVAHGRRGDPPPAINPRAAYDRLLRLWQIISSNSPAIEKLEESTPIASPPGDS